MYEQPVLVTHRPVRKSARGPHIRRILGKRGALRPAGDIEETRESQRTTILRGITLIAVIGGKPDDSLTREFFQ